jgi:hypothetical protein
MVTILKGLVGSHAYGYATPESDKDWMTVYVGGIDTYFGLNGAHTSHSTTNDLDITDYEFKKFVSLCCNFNPNVIPLLFLKKESYDSITNEFGLRLVQAKNLFLTKRCYNSLRGYATSQEKKIRHGLTEKLGQKRNDLIDKYGYDVKAAAHSVRLLRLAKHIFLYNEVDLEEAAEECMKYRFGFFSKEEFQNRFDELIRQVDNSFSSCLLPEDVDMTTVNAFCVRFLKDWFK